ncbi:MAG: 2-C-methyl-D-erythritol 4-phosphate cytidylyltransferase [Acidobacteriota bacterium]|nr:2-C-methyl-D-erythritol 4-phosphate cytidylyltransferase [Acidobacteriota bacterium]
MAVALIVAAGRGERLGLDRPKALVPVAGRPMLAWSVAALQAVPAIERIVVALPPDALDHAPAGTTAVAGGRQRSHSVANALAACPDDGDPVVVHDAARPLVTPALVARALEELERHPGCSAAILATPVADTIKEVGDDRATVLRTLDRSRLWAVQTPQAFRRQALAEALAGAGDDELAAATDDAWLVERAGGTVRVLASDPLNIKITNATDMRLAELLLAERR